MNSLQMEHPVAEGVAKVFQISKMPPLWLYACMKSSHLKGFLSGVDELVALELGALDKGLAALGAHVHPGPVRVEVLPHCAGGGKLG